MNRETVTTVATLMHALRDLDPELPVVVGCGIGYENPRLDTTWVRPVLVRNRFLFERGEDGTEALVLRPTND